MRIVIFVRRLGEEGKCEITPKVFRPTPNLPTHSDLPIALAHRTPFNRQPRCTTYSLHFGWVSCATLVNLNNYVSLVPSFSKKVMLRFSLASAAAAVALAVAVTVQTGDPVYAGVVSWALSAVASHNSKKASSASEKVGSCPWSVHAIAWFMQWVDLSYWSIRGIGRFMLLVGGFMLLVGSYTWLLKYP